MGCTTGEKSLETKPSVENSTPVFSSLTDGTRSLAAMVYLPRLYLNSISISLDGGSQQPRRLPKILGITPLVVLCRVK